MYVYPHSPQERIILSAKNLTLYITANTAGKMEKLPEVNWSEIARHAIETYIDDRLNTSIPSSILERLRQEKGDEFVAGRKFVVQEILPSLGYKHLDSFFRAVEDKAERRRQNEAAFSGIEAQFIGVPLQEIALEQLPLFFRIDENATSEFLKGVFAALQDAHHSLKEK